MDKVFSMDEVFKYIKSNPYPMKGMGGRIGYGCLFGKRAKYNRIAKRKVGRWIKKRGFDTSEIWSLDFTIGAWLSDNVGGFFRQCGNFDDWSDYDLEGNCYYDFKNPDIKPFLEAETARRALFLHKLNGYLLKESNTHRDEFIAFVVPRIKYLADTTIGYPPENFHDIDEWKNCLKRMAEDLETKHYSNSFITYFFALWY